MDTLIGEITEFADFPVFPGIPYPYTKSIAFDDPGVWNLNAVKEFTVKQARTQLNPPPFPSVSTWCMNFAGVTVRLIYAQ